MTCDQLRQDLSEVQQMLAALDSRRTLDRGQLEDLRWLTERRDVLAALFDARRRELARKVVRLAVWRGDRLAA